MNVHNGCLLLDPRLRALRLLLVCDDFAGRVALAESLLREQEYILSNHNQLIDATVALLNVPESKHFRRYARGVLKTGRRMRELWDDDADLIALKLAARGQEAPREGQDAANN